MRYELSMEQYSDFLNSLTRTQQNNRTATDISATSFVNNFVLSETSSVSIRNAICCEVSGHGTTAPINFFCNYNEDVVYDDTPDGQNIACNFLLWEDGLAYMDWAGLRPFTELEFEKACRGTAYPSAFDYAWGTDAPTQTATVLIDEGQPTETVSNNGDGLSNFNNSSGNFGPLRCGFAATASTNRVQAGGSYYGVMEMSGNLSERCITVGSATGRAFTGIHGNGELSVDGNANVSNWPDSGGQAFRGGSFRRNMERMRVSDRTHSANTVNNRYDGVGWRGARTVD